MKIPHIFLTGHPSAGKTTIIKNVQASQNSSDFITRGFYTEEYRKSGERIGFDIVYWAATPDDGSRQTQPQRESLSRMVQRIQKGQPHVGKYLVDVDNIKDYAIESLKSVTTFTNDKNELMILDEVGKMEMCCPDFIPAVTDLLNETTTRTRIILGTIPTPRYGRVIATVEDIRSRDDVVVIHVTKSNRDEIREVLHKAIQDLFSDKSGKIDIRRVLEPYIYSRPIGASSMDGNNTSKTIDPKGKNIISSHTKPCGPLVPDSIEPKILIMGETSSPLPSNIKYSYCERSMWIVLGQMFGVAYKPIQDIETANEKDLNTFLSLRDTVISRGICVWDLFANVHEKSGKKKKKRPRQTIEATPNDIETFLKEHPSIQLIGFIGQKALSKYNCLRKERRPSSDYAIVELVSLPSSSPVNTRVSVDEKAAAWKGAMSKVIPEFEK
jgi:nucleoside-triphosphatase